MTIQEPVKLRTIRCGDVFTPDMNNGKNIFVFGSNLSGRHGAGAAKEAKEHWNADYGVGIGIQGQAYAIPTKDHHLSVLPITTIKYHVDDFIDYAKQHSDLTFLVTAVGTGLAAYPVERIAPLFAKCPGNCVLPSLYLNVLYPGYLANGTNTKK